MTGLLTVRDKTHLEADHKHNLGFQKGITMKTYESIALGIPKILLPKAGTDLSKWAVIACDQYTSDPDYWRDIGNLVGDAPSALNLIFPVHHRIQLAFPRHLR